MQHLCNCVSFIIFICHIALAHSMRQILKPVCTVSVSVCAHSHGRIS